MKLQRKTTPKFSYHYILFKEFQFMVIPFTLLH